MTWEKEAGMKGRKRVSKEGEERKKMMELDLDFAQTSAVIVNMVVLYYHHHYHRSSQENLSRSKMCVI